MSVLRAPCSVLFALIIGAAPAHAQVGHDPARSPYRDIPRGSGFVLMGGYLAGDRGEVDVGPGPGQTFTARYDLGLGGPVVFTTGASLMRLDRYVLDPDSGAATRKSGPFVNDLLTVDAGVHIRLTGAKTWRRVAPYVSGTIGLGFELSGPSDPGGYSFGTKFTLAPGAGIRIHPGRHLFLIGDFRWTFWRLSYPLTYRISSPVDSTTILRPAQEETDWTSHPWLSVGVGWIF